jgi:hypothetical protein
MIKSIMSPLVASNDIQVYQKAGQFIKFLFVLFHKIMTSVSHKDIEESKGATESAVVEKYLFFVGFFIPIVWFIGSNSCGNQHTYEAFVWKKRCRIAATLTLTLLIVIAAIVMVVNPKLFGLKTEYATGAQTSSASSNAIRPGVPIIGTNDWGDTVAGISIDSNR